MKICCRVCGETSFGRLLIAAPTVERHYYSQDAAIIIIIILSRSIDENDRAIQEKETKEAKRNHLLSVATLCYT